MEFSHGKSAYHYPMMKGICVVCGLLVSLAALLNLFGTHNYTFASIQILYLASSIYTYRKITHNQLKTSHIFTNIAILSFVVLYTSAEAKLRSGIIITTLAMPAIYHVFLNRPLAGVMSALVGGATLTLVYYKSEGSLSFLLFNYALSYCGIWAISSAYEKAREQVHQQLEYQATHDVLSRARNRLALQYDFSQQQQQHRYVSLLHIDIDHFKQINDSYGHLVGDRVIQSLVKTLQQQFSEQLVYRIGGEEFLVLRWQVPLEQAAAEAEFFRSTIESLNIDNMGRTVHTSVSIGVCQCSTQLELKDMLSQSDYLLYQAKRHGRNQIKLPSTVN